MKKLQFISLIFLAYSITCFSQVRLLTTAERSAYSSTSDYKDVISFIDQLKKSSPYIRSETLATSVEGREIPLLVVGNPLPGGPEDLINDKRIVVYIQANIHAGEVEGKEATLMYLRDLLEGKDQLILKDVVLLVCPIFNADGNEKIDPRNRTNQNGPVNGVGLRHNGQFLDLNRDAMKAESPEFRGLLSNVFNRWDPSVFMDCHTTNGSYHVEPVTFTWMINPNGDNALISYMRDKMMPEMSGRLYNKYGIDNCYYGEFYDMMYPEKGWVMDPTEPRYIVNYYGIRNRLAILNENYVYADFKSRVNGCYFLIHSLIDYVSVHTTEIKDMLHEADNKTILRGSNPSVADSFAIEYTVNAAPDLVTIKTYEAEIVSDPNGRRSYRRSDRQKNVTVPYYIDYYPVKSVKFPFAYLITTFDPDIINLLKRHGIKLEKLSGDSRITVEKFSISELKSEELLNQGHHTNTISGKYLEESIDFPAGTMVIRLAQPLANVASYLLEPQSNDGMITWNFFDRFLVPQWGGGYNPYPVYRVMEKIDLVTERIE